VVAVHRGTGDVLIFLSKIVAFAAYIAFLAFCFALYVTTCHWVGNSVMIDADTVSLWNLFINTLVVLLLVVQFLIEVLVCVITGRVFIEYMEY
jgi:hypothetical protein